jgi:hypothetical protein
MGGQLEQRNRRKLTPCLDGGDLAYLGIQRDQIRFDAVSEQHASQGLGDGADLEREIWRMTNEGET